MRNLLYKKEKYSKLPIKRKKEKKRRFIHLLVFSPLGNSYRVTFYQWKLSLHHPHLESVQEPQNGPAVTPGGGGFGKAWGEMDCPWCLNLIQQEQGVPALPLPLRGDSFPSLPGPCPDYIPTSPKALPGSLHIVEPWHTGAAKDQHKLSPP